MILEEGDKLLVVHRRLFENDKSRYFIGLVDGYENGIVKVSGHTWVKEQFGGTYFKKSDLRTKIFSLSSGTLMVYRLPQDVDLRYLKLDRKDGQEILTDDSKFKMDLAEYEQHKTTKKTPHS